MGRRILVINGHPDAGAARFASALAGAYLHGASAAGHLVRRLDVGAMRFPLLRTPEDFRRVTPEAILTAQAAIAWADHVVIIFPLWLGSTPAVLSGFFEQVFRYGVALSPPAEPMVRLFRGRSARLVVTMGMPSHVHRWIFGAFGVRRLERGLLWMTGFGPIRRTILGEIEGHARRRARWLAQVEALGRRAG